MADQDQMHLPGMGNQHPDRRITDAGIAVVRTQLEALNQNVMMMRLSITEMAEDTRKIALLEERNVTQGQAIERAFGEIKVLQTKHDNHEKEATAKRTQYDRVINILVGAGMAICVLWTVFGLFIAGEMKDSVATLSEMRVHIQTDKLTDPEQVRLIIREEKQK